MSVEGETTTAPTEATTEAAADTTLVTAPSAEGEKPAAETPPAEGEKPAAEGEKPAEGEKKDGEDDAHATIGAPEAYADFEKPEGIEFDNESLDAFRETAKELDLSQDAANKLVQHAFKLQERWTEQLGNEVLAERQGWLEATQADKDIGGEKLPETLATAKRAMDAYGDESFTTLLNETGLGNHPSMIRLLANVGKSVSEDGFVGGPKPAVSPTATLAERLYPSAKKE